MPLANIDHTSIRTLRLEESREFYENVLGMTVGDRPNFDFPGYWLYLNDHAVIHLVGIDPNNLDGLKEYLGEINMDELSGSGAVDHLAFVAAVFFYFRNSLMPIISILFWTIGPRVTDSRTAGLLVKLTYHSATLG